MVQNNFLEKKSQSLSWKHERKMSFIKERLKKVSFAGFKLTLKQELRQNKTQV